MGGEGFLKLGYNNGVRFRDAEIFALSEWSLPSRGLVPFRRKSRLIRWDEPAEIFIF